MTFNCKFCGRPGMEWGVGGAKPFPIDSNSGVPHRCDREERKRYQEIHKPELGEISQQEIQKNSPRHKFLLDRGDLTPSQMYWRDYWIGRSNEIKIKTYNPHIQIYPPDLFLIDHLTLSYKNEVVPEYVRNPLYHDHEGFYHEERALLNHQRNGTLE